MRKVTDGKGSRRRKAPAVRRGGSQGDRTGWVGIGYDTSHRQRGRRPLAALHYCFRSKDELLEEVYNFLSRDYAKALDPVPDPGMGLRHMVGAHARRIWSRMLENPTNRSPRSNCCSDASGWKPTTSPRHCS